MAQKLTDSAQMRLDNINYSLMGFSALGGIGGVFYSHKTGGGFWRGVGYYLLGSLAVGTVVGLAALPFKNAIIKNGTEKDNYIPCPFNSNRTYIPTYDENGVEVEVDESNVIID